MNKIKKILRCIIFVAIGLIIFWILTNMILPKTNYTTIIGEFYQEPENSLDVVFIGDSSIYRAIIPIEIWREHGVTSYNFSSAALKIWDEYYCLEEVLKYQKPKVVVLNIETIFGSQPMKNEYQRHLYDNMKLSKNKINAIIDPIQQINQERQISFMMTLLRFHDRWKGLQDRDFECALGQTYHSNDVFKGYWIEQKVQPYKKGKQANLNSKINENAATYLEKIQELCKKNHIQLLLIETPAIKTWSIERNKEMDNWAKKHNVLFLDCNEVKESIGIDWQTDTYDGGDHLNIKGAQKLTKYMGNFLVQKYNLTNHKNDSDYQSWNEEVKRYDNRIQERANLIKGIKQNNKERKTKKQEDKKKSKGLDKK